MELTGKCRNEFDDWLIQQKYKFVIPSVLKYKDTIYVSMIFYSLPNSMKYGVLEDYFGSIGIFYNYSYNSIIGEYYVFVQTLTSEDVFFVSEIRAREKARDVCVEKAIEIRNEQLK